MKEITQATQYQQQAIANWDIDLEFMNDKLAVQVNEADSDERKKHLKGVQHTFDRLGAGIIQSHRTHGRRVFNSVSSIERSMRHGFSANGRELVEFDCANSHPLLLCKMFTDEGMNIEHEIRTIAESGDFYDIFKWDMPRDEIKVSVYQCFYNKGGINTNNPVYKELLAKFPLFADALMAASKKGTENSLAKQMQAKESEIWIDTVSNTLMFAGIPHCTTHDGVVFDPVDQQVIDDVYTVVIKAYGNLKPTLHFETLQKEPAKYSYDLSHRMDKYINMANAYNGSDASPIAEIIADLSAWQNEWSAMCGFIGFYYDPKKQAIQSNIENADLIDHLTRKGYKKISVEKGENPYVCIADNIIMTVKSDEMKAEFVNFINNGLPNRIFGIDSKAILNSYHRREVKDSMHFSYLPVLTDQELRRTRPDTKTTSFIPFRNGVLKVMADSVELVPYSQHNGLVWKEFIIDADYKATQTSNSEVSRFLYNISGPKQSEVDQAEKEMDAQLHQKLMEEKHEAMKDLRVMLGYLTHPHKDRAKAIMPILLDENTENPERGGAGKSLTIDLAKVIRPAYHSVDANTEEVQWQFTEIKHGHQIVRLDEMKQYYQLEKLNGHITGDFRVNVKGGGIYTIPFEISAKLAGTNNYMVDLNKPGVKRRIRLYEINNFYSIEYDPVDDFGHRLMDDWNSVQQMIEINYMVEGLQLFLQEGIRDSSVTDVNEKLLKLKLGDDMYHGIHNLLKRTSGFIGTYDAMEEVYNVCGWTMPTNGNNEGIKNFSTDMKTYLDVMKIKYEKREQVSSVTGKRARGYYITS